MSTGRTVPQNCIERERESELCVNTFIEKDSGFSSGSCKGSTKQAEFRKGSCVDRIKNSSNWYVQRYTFIMFLYSLTPSVLWSQSRDQVILNVPLRGCDDYEVNVNDSYLNMWSV